MSGTSLVNFMSDHVWWRTVWLTATAGRRFTRRQYQDIPVTQLCCDLEQLEEECITLRVKAILSNGITIIFEKQVDYLISDVKLLMYSVKPNQVVKKRNENQLKDDTTALFSVNDISMIPEDMNYESDPSVITLPDDLSIHSRIIEVPPDEGFDDSVSISSDWVPIIDGTPCPQLPPTPQPVVTPNAPPPPVRTPQLPQNFVSPLIDRDPPAAESPPRRAKRRLKFDRVTELKEETVTQCMTTFNPFKIKCPQKIKPKQVLSLPSSSIVHPKSQLMKLWQDNLWSTKLLSSVSEEESLSKSDMELLRKGVSYDEVGSSWTNATPIYDESYGMSSNRSSEFDFIMSNIKRTIGDGGRLAPIADNEDSYDDDICEVDESFDTDSLSIQIRRRLESQESTGFNSLVSHNVMKREAASSFYTLLELLNLGVIKASQGGSYEEILLTKGDYF